MIRCPNGHENPDGTTYDCGDKIGFVEATVAYALSRPDLAGKVREALRKFG